jgi:galactose oxidase
MKPKLQHPFPTMKTPVDRACRMMCVCLLLASLFAGSRSSLVRADELPDPSCLEVVVGITPNCPYGMKSCWPNARAALQRVSLVKRIDDVDYYNCTASLLMKEPGLPDVEKLRKEFTGLMGETYFLRGIEITLKGTLEIKDGVLHLTSSAPALSIPLAKLEHKLQWNYHKQRARGPENEERIAYQELLEKVTTAGAGASPVRASVTGPLHTSAPGASPVLEVREYLELQSTGY